MSKNRVYSMKRGATSMLPTVIRIALPSSALAPEPYKDSKTVRQWVSHCSTVLLLPHPVGP